MAVSVSRDLSVSVTTDINADKLTDRRQALRESIQKGEPKALGVSQVMIGVMVMSYSIPLLSTEFTEVVTFGVPWWSGLSLGVCMVVTLVAILVSLLAIIFYFIDLHNNPETPCNHSLTPATHYIQLYECDHQHYATVFSYGIKSSLLLFTIIQITISSTLSYIMYMERRHYGPYSSLNQGVPSTPILVTAPDFN
ncbi:membrane-spanning 4-domains subfamily A member 12-like isoform X2 [Salvelinus namaycush]|uniref:Membrane-spanning 4-domains subfamily A member 12-like isoform X2 n=1 Tax=Salvelinus namaycush TaxID=8040 RepID=A0A8U0Q6S1_SALNM|nr:membrane-spanning 4-domains subfamily A member 12-like isoform X2 [Salvelinus namaycush]